MLDRTIILYADEFDHDVWEEYCDIVGVSHYASSITIKFNHKDVEVDEEKDEELTDEDYEDQFGSEMAIRICRANNIPLSQIEEYGSDAYWINDGINNLQDLYDINENFVIPTGDEDLIRDYREEILEEGE